MSEGNPGTAPVVNVPEARRLRLSHGTFQNQDFRNRDFLDLNASGSRFSGCNFSFSIFTRAYLKNAVFENCTFTGCRFYDCNFRSVSLYLCDFRFSTFHRSLVDVREMLATLPSEPNLRRELLQNLRANAAEIGDYESQKPLVLAEVQASIDHWSGAFNSADGYYRKKYSSFVDRSLAALRLVGLRVGGAIWGHGEQPSRLLFSATVILLILSLINFWSVIPREGWAPSLAGLNIALYSLNVFLDMPVDVTFRGFPIIDYILVSMRYLYIGLFISVVFKSISHR